MGNIWLFLGSCRLARVVRLDFVTSDITLPHLRSKEITGIHKPCIPHSNDSSATTEYKPVCIQM